MLIRYTVLEKQNLGTFRLDLPSEHDVREFVLIVDSTRLKREMSQRDKTGQSTNGVDYVAVDKLAHIMLARLIHALFTTNDI